MLLSERGLRARAKVSGRGTRRILRSGYRVRGLVARRRGSRLTLRRRPSRHAQGVLRAHAGAAGREFVPLAPGRGTRLVVLRRGQGVVRVAALERDGRLSGWPCVPSREDRWSSRKVGRRRSTLAIATDPVVPLSGHLGSCLSVRYDAVHVDRRGSTARPGVPRARRREPPRDGRPPVARRGLGERARRTAGDVAAVRDAAPRRAAAQRPRALGEGRPRPDVPARARPDAHARAVDRRAPRDLGGALRPPLQRPRRRLPPTDPGDRR